MGSHPEQAKQGAIVAEGVSVELRGFAGRLNQIAVATLREDGEHGPMFFLRMPDDRIETRLFSPAEESVGERRAAEMANASGDAGAVAFVSEASATPMDDLPAPCSAGGRSRTRDVLLVAAIDRSGATVAFETPVRRREDGSVETGESRVYGGEYALPVFDGVRATWGLRGVKRRDLGSGVSAEVPEEWEVRQADNVIELVPPSESAAAHVSVFRRRTPEPVKAGDARSFIERFPVWREARERVGPTERHDGAEAVATASCLDAERGARWEIGVRVGPSYALVFSYNDDGREDDLRDAARGIFASVRREALSR